MLIPSQKFIEFIQNLVWEFVLFIYTKFQGNWFSISCFITIFEKCVKTICAPGTPLRRKKQRIFFKSSYLGEIFFRFEMWPSLSGGHIYSKLGAIRIRHHGATYGWKSRLSCSCQNILKRLHVPHFLKELRDTTACLDFR